MTDDLVKRLRLIGTRVGVTNRMRDAVAGREAADRIEKLEKALHCISLGSQDSGTTKESLGREARKALEGKND